MTTVDLPISSNVLRAGNILAYEVLLFSNTIGEFAREDYFHPMNRDQWVASFCEWLAAKQRKSAEVRASND